MVAEFDKWISGRVDQTAKFISKMDKMDMDLCDSFDFGDLEYLDDSAFFPLTLAPSSPGYQSGSTSSSASSDSDSVSSLDLTNSKKRMRYEKNPLGHMGGVYFNQRRNGRIVPHIILPKILKNDIRRSYGTMFTNVMNSSDTGLLRHFLSTYCQINSVFVKECSSEPAETKEATHCDKIEVSGASAIWDFWSSGLMTIPDLVFNTDGTSLKLRSDGTGLLEFKFNFAGTSLVSEQVEEENRLVPLAEQACQIKMHKMSLGVAGPKKMIPFSVQGNGMMHLDSDKKVYFFQFFGDAKASFIGAKSVMQYRMS